MVIGRWGSLFSFCQLFVYNFIVLEKCAKVTFSFVSPKMLVGGWSSATSMCPISLHFRQPQSMASDNSMVASARRWFCPCNFRHPFYQHTKRPKNVKSPTQMQPEKKNALMKHQNREGLRIISPLFSGHMIILRGLSNFLKNFQGKAFCKKAW